MMFVDTNILIDVVENDPVWADWSQQQLAVAAGFGTVAINDIVYAELAIGYQNPEDLDAMIAQLRIVVVPRSSGF